MSISFGDGAGAITIAWKTKQGYWHLHLWVHKDFRQYGRTESWYDGPLYSYGFGRLFLLCWCGR